jgi:predicted nucleic acid-binding protein
VNYQVVGGNMQHSKYLLDTGVFIKYYRGEERAVNFLNQQLELASAISILTVTEVLVGFKKKAQQDTAARFLKKFPVIQVDWSVAKITSNLIQSKSDYFGKKVHRGTIDAFIAASAISQNLTLVTLNKKHFQKLRYPGFKRIILQEEDQEWLIK